MGFSPGQIVCLASNPSIRGAVVEALAGPLEDRIMVFVNGDVQSYYASNYRPLTKAIASPLIPRPNFRPT